MVVVCIGFILARPGNTRNKNDDDGGGSSLYPLGSCEYSLPLLYIKGNGLAWTCCTANKKEMRPPPCEQQATTKRKPSGLTQGETNETSAKGGNDDDDQDGQKTRDINVGRRKLHLGLLNVKKRVSFFFVVIVVFT